MARTTAPAPDKTRDSIKLPVYFTAIAVIFLGAIVLVAGVVVLFTILGVDPFANL